MSNALAVGKPYGKAVLAILGTIFTALVTALGDNHVSDSEWVNVAVLAVGTAAVFFGPNTQYARYTKTWLAALSAGLVALQSVITDGVSQAELLQIGIAVLTAAGVYLVPNKGTAE